MTDDTSDWKIPYRRALEESIEFLGRDGKFARECWVVGRLLHALNVEFSESQLQRGDEPVDVQFLDASFQVKELMEIDRRRGDELQASLSKLQEADSLADMMEQYSPKEITFNEVVDLALTKAAVLEARGYGPSEIERLDLLCYFNYLDYSVIGPLQVERSKSRFRSVSVVSNTYCGVIHASDHAPQFLRSNVGVAQLCDITQ